MEFYFAPLLVITKGFCLVGLPEIHINYQFPNLNHRVCIKIQR